MRTIWKFKLALATEQRVTMPSVNMFRHCAIQGEDICLWFEVDAKSPERQTTFYIVGTGHKIPADAAVYRGSVLMGDFVWHVYES